MGIKHDSGSTCMSGEVTVSFYSSHEINDIINWIW
jgi:hypothetical protein